MPRARASHRAAARHRSGHRQQRLRDAGRHRRRGRPRGRVRVPLRDRPRAGARPRRRRRLVLALRERVPAPPVSAPRRSAARRIGGPGLRRGGAAPDLHRTPGRGPRHRSRPRRALHRPAALRGRPARVHRDRWNPPLRAHRPRHPAGGSTPDPRGHGGRGAFEVRGDRDRGQHRDHTVARARERPRPPLAGERPGLRGGAGRSTPALRRHLERDRARAAAPHRGHPLVRRGARRRAGDHPRTARGVQPHRDAALRAGHPCVADLARPAADP